MEQSDKVKDIQPLASLSINRIKSAAMLEPCHRPNISEMNLIKFYLTIKKFK